MMTLSTGDTTLTKGMLRETRRGVGAPPCSLPINIFPLTYFSKLQAVLILELGGEWSFTYSRSGGQGQGERRREECGERVKKEESKRERRERKEGDFLPSFLYLHNTRPDLLSYLVQQLLTMPVITPIWVGGTPNPVHTEPIVGLLDVTYGNVPKSRSITMKRNRGKRYRKEGKRRGGKRRELGKRRKESRGDDGLYLRGKEDKSSRNIY